MGTGGGYTVVAVNQVGIYTAYMVCGSSITSTTGSYNPAATWTTPANPAGGTIALKLQ
jgi:hypothetical protein